MVKFLVDLSIKTVMINSIEHYRSSIILIQITGVIHVIRNNLFFFQQGNIETKC